MLGWQAKGPRHRDVAHVVVALCHAYSGRYTRRPVSSTAVAAQSAQQRPAAQCIQAARFIAMDSPTTRKTDTRTKSKSTSSGLEGRTKFPIRVWEAKPSVVTQPGTVGSKQQLLIKYLRRRPPLEHAVSKMFDCSPLQLLWGCAVWISDALRCSPGALHACRAHQRVDTEAGDCPWPVLHGRAPHHQPGCSISTSSVIDNSRGTACAYHPHV